MDEEKVWQRPIETVGVIGLGGVGRQICRKLARERSQAGIGNVACFDAAVSALTGPDEGEVTVCMSIAHLVDMVDLVLLCLPDAGEVGRVARSHEGLLDCVHQDQVIVDHSWSSFELTRQLATAFSSRGAAFLDAPIGWFNDVDRAADAGLLAFAISGDTAAIDAVLPRLRLYARQVTKVGPIGAAQVVRQMGDLVALQTFAALAEASLTARAFGVDADRLFEALAREHRDVNGIGHHSLMEFLGADGAAAQDRTSIADAGRRLRDAIQLAEDKNLALTSAGSTLALLERAVDQGFGKRDLSGLFSMIAPPPQSARRETS